MRLADHERHLDVYVARGRRDGAAQKIDEDLKVASLVAIEAREVAGVAVDPGA